MEEFFSLRDLNGSVLSRRSSASSADAWEDCLCIIYEFNGVDIDGVVQAASACRYLWSAVEGIPKSVILGCSFLLVSQLFHWGFTTRNLP